MAETYLDLDPGENIVLVRHQYIAAIFPIIVSVVVVLAILAFILGYANNNSQVLNGIISIQTARMIALVVGLFAVVVLVVAILTWLQNKIILTDHHYMQINQRGLFGRDVSKLTLDEIQDATGRREGVTQTFFNYGEILIETAGEQTNFFFKPVKDPLDLAETINDAHREYCKLHPPGGGV